MTPANAERAHSPLRPMVASSPHGSTVFTAEALVFLRDLIREFDPRRWALLEQRQRHQQQWDDGQLPDFDPETAEWRQGDWQVAEIPAELRDRRVEITGPVDRKMIINALNSGARVFMADFEDSSSPTWDNMVEGQRNLMDAVRGTIRYRSPEGKEYRLGPDPAVLMVRPRGLHLPEVHLQLDGQAVGASLVDAGTFLFHNAHRLLDSGHGPYLYLPKLEHWREAAWWEEVLSWCESRLGLPAGSVKVTVLIETLPAAFQMDEILYTLRERIVGLNCGRWDYIFSTIKVFRKHSDRVLPDRAQVGMTVPFLRAYSRRLIATCHRRGALAMGGMAAQIPVRGDDAANEAALAAVRADKEREVGDGHDGTWVAHPGLIPLALEVFDTAMPGPNQLEVQPEADFGGREELLAQPEGTRTESGGRGCVDVAVRYLANWLCGRGCVPIHRLMEDAATAEIARAQLWQWAHHGAPLEDGSEVSVARVEEWIDDTLAELGEEFGADTLERERYPVAAELLRRMVASPELHDFLTLLAYPLLEEETSR